MHIHQFKNSKKTEEKSLFLHDEVYIRLNRKVNENKNVSLIIDRSACDYNDFNGRLYQQADTDVILTFNDEITKCLATKKVSEKTRNKFYNDLYLEVISVLEKDIVDDKYKIKAEGWAFKTAVDSMSGQDFSPDYLSVLFLDKKQNKYTAIFVRDYKKLKEEIIKNDTKNLVNSESFLDWLNFQIKQSNSNSFQVDYSCYQKKSNKSNSLNINKVVFAKNSKYYTIGFTYNMKQIKEVAKVAMLSGSIIKENLIQKFKR